MLEARHHSNRAERQCARAEHHRAHRRRPVSHDRRPRHQPDEFWAGVDWLTRLGLERPGRAHHRRPRLRSPARHPRSTKPTNAPAATAARRAPSKARCTSPAHRWRKYEVRVDERRAKRGETMVMEGRVLDIDGKPVAGAIVDVWHANELGRYSHFDPDQAELRPAPPHRDRRTGPLSLPQLPAAGLCDSARTARLPSCSPHSAATATARRTSTSSWPHPAFAR